MSVGLIFNWSRDGVIGNIQVGDPNPVSDTVVFSIDSCLPGLQNLLRQTDVPPSPLIPVSFTLVPSGGHWMATNVDRQV
ncbi:MAG: hypothetical protein QOG23_1746 [Blastocatellia bacterium]|jgi:hypothetical protein|nr:hypothetical protein [Blastocatellia bacterium]